MVKTGKRAAALRGLLEAAGLTFRARGGLLRITDLGLGARDQVRGVHAMLGGLSNGQALLPGAWDLQTTDGLAIELDEQFHFTRYRAATLRALSLRELPWAPAYERYCAAYEDAAAQGGGRWTSPPSERMFGPSDPVKVFGAFGSARGKQRALYDAMKDTAAATGAVRLARISIYDTVDGVRLDDILYGKRTVMPAAVRQIIEARIHQAT